MASGKQSVTIDSDELVGGMTTSDNLADGGFSPYSEGINLVANPGVIYASPAVTSPGILDGKVISSCYDTYGSNTLTIDKYLVTDNASLYVLKSGALTNLGSLGTASNFFPGAVDSLQFDYNHSTAHLQVYVSNTNDVSLVDINPNNLATTFTNNWFSGLGGSPGTFTNRRPHPMLKFTNGNLYIADGNLLHMWNGSSMSFSVLTLENGSGNSNGEVINALGIDPGSGKMLISISSRGVTSSTGQFTLNRPSQSYIALYDGISPVTLQRKVPVDDTVLSFSNCEGVTYVTYGDNIGTWNGSGITFLRKLNISYGQVDSTLNYIPFKHKVCNIQNFICFAVNQGNIKNPWLTNNSDKIMVYGQVKSKQSSFFNVYTSGTGGKIDFISNYRDTGVIFSTLVSGITNLYVVPFLDSSLNANISSPSVLVTGDNSPVFVSKRLTFERPCQVNQVRIFFEDSVAANGTIIGNLGVIDDNNTVMYNEDLLNPSTASATHWFDIFPDVNITTECELKYQWKETTTNHGIQKIMVFFTPYE